MKCQYDHTGENKNIKHNNRRANRNFLGQGSFVGIRALR